MSEQIRQQEDVPDNEKLLEEYELIRQAITKRLGSLLERIVAAKRTTTPKYDTQDALFEHIIPLTTQLQKKYGKSRLEYIAWYGVGMGNIDDATKIKHKDFPWPDSINDFLDDLEKKFPDKE